MEGNLNYDDIGEVVAWCEEHSDVPDNSDEPYVVNYEFKAKEEQYVRIFISTQRLLTIAVRVNHLHADATYKLIYEGYPVLLVGITDMNRSFHPCGIAITCSEKSEDYAFLFKSWKISVKFTCTCSDFLKQYLCIHTLGVGNTLDMLDFPDKATSCNLKLKRGPGRPKTMFKALAKP